MSQLPEVQRAIRALGGVSSAHVRWPDPDGPATLHVRFSEGADRDEVQDQIAAILEGVGDVDLSTLETDDPPGGRQEADVAEHPPCRPAFAGLLVDTNELDAAVDVTLMVNGRRLTGHAEGLATGPAITRTAAAATLRALREILPEGVRVELEWLRTVDPEVTGGPRVVHTVVTMLTRTGQESLVGSAPVRGDDKEAAVRATLSALNRRLERTLHQPA